MSEHFQKKCSCSQANLCVLGAMLIKLAMSIINCWGNTNLYYLSYFREQGYTFTASSNSIIVLVIIFPMIICMLISPYLCNRFGYEFVTKCSAFAFLIIPQLVNINFNFYLFIFCCLIIPTCSFAISTIPVLNCVWTQFPSSKNKITAVVVFAFGGGSFIWNLLFMHLINPQNKEATIKDGQLYFFDTSVTGNIQESARIGFLICGFLVVIGSFLLKRKQPSQQNKGTNNALSSESGEGENITKSQALKDIRFILIFLISILIGIFQIHLYLNIKILYQQYIQDDHFLAYCTIAGTIISIFAAFGWGYLGDLKGFAKTLLVIVIIDTFVKIYSDFAINKTTIMIMFILIGINSRSIVTIQGPGFIQIYGLSIGTQLLPFKGIAILLSFIIAPLGQIITEGWMTPRQYLIALSFLNIPILIMTFILYRKLSTGIQQNNDKQLAQQI